MNTTIKNKYLYIIMITVFILTMSTVLYETPLFGQSPTEVKATTISELQHQIDNSLFTTNNLWLLLSTLLVFLMHLGFSTLEVGLTTAKNTVNILFKNFMIVAIGLLTYALCGFNLMYPGDTWIVSQMFGFAGFGIGAPLGDAGLIDYADGAYTYYTDFLFQGMFAATAATIVSGAVAGRIKLNSFLIFTAVYVGFCYPLLGSWKWGGGWLDNMGFYDFAGSTLVHSVGGWAALVGALFLGARTGRYKNGMIKAMPGHSMPLATIGVFFLWLGWFGFNGGSVLSAEPGLISLVLVTTNIAATSGIMGAYIISLIVQKKPDLSMVLNGALAGLVGITAGADVVSVMDSVVIGFIAGVLVVVSILFIDQICKIDDPVGAISVHLVCGIWGTLAVGIFSSNPEHKLWLQFVGVVAYGAASLLFASILFGALKYTMGIRVTKKEELEGLDISEHGMEAYPGFQIFTHQ